MVKFLEKFKPFKRSNERLNDCDSLFIASFETEIEKPMDEKESTLLAKNRVRVCNKCILLMPYLFLHYRTDTIKNSQQKRQTIVRLR